VILAAAFVLAGGAVFLYVTPSRLRITGFQGEPEECARLRDFHEALALHGRGLIQLGLLILIATPIARVRFRCGVFVPADWMYVR